MHNLYDYLTLNLLYGRVVKISVGVAIANKEDGLLDKTKLLQTADKALYQSKGNGKNQFTFYQS